MDGRIGADKRSIQRAMKSNILFISYADSLEEWVRVRTLEKSLRRFGGEISRSRILVYDVLGEGIPEDFTFLEDVEVQELSVPAGIRKYIFAAKVTAMAQAEVDHPEESQTLAWIDPSCLIMNPPLLYKLDDGSQAAFRPVHIQNVGLRADDPLDRYWSCIYKACGLKDNKTQVDSFVDGQTLRAYFNTHAFSISPAIGLMNTWLEVFTSLVLDRDFQISCCQDIRHQVFLFQAILSALLVREVTPDRLRILPPSYNYPCNLQSSIPLEKRINSMDHVVSLTYEGKTLDPDQITDIEIPAPYYDFLKQVVP
jgi:hypothetical protein